MDGIGRWLVLRLRGIEGLLRRRTTSVAAVATRFHRLLFYVVDLVFWSRVFRSRRGPIPVELPPFLLRHKGVTAEAPVLHVSGMQDEVAHWDDGFSGIYAVLFENLQTPDVLSDLRYAHPAPAFRGVYLWDSAFIAQVWKPWDRQVAQEVAEVVVRLRDGDRLQHVVSDFVASAFTQPPLVAWSLARIWEGDRRLPEGAEEIYEALTGYDRWLEAHRRLDNGLYFWEHPYESGVENAPRFSSRDERVLSDTRGTAAPDLCAYVVLQKESLSSWAARLGRDGDAGRHEEEAETLRRRVRELLWHEEDGLFYDREERSGTFTRSRTIASLMPLWAGIPDAAQADRLMEHVLAEDGFNSLVPLPSVALGDPDFAKDMWRGPVWVNTAYGVLQGLNRYGREREASALAYRLCDAVYRIYRRERRFYEFYDPLRLDLEELHRKKGNRWKAFTLGTKPQPDFVGWTGLVNTLVVEQFFGFHCRDGRRFFRPGFPPEAVGKGYSLRLPGEKISCDVEVRGADDFRVTVRHESGATESLCGFGDLVPVDPAPVSDSNLPRPLCAIVT